MWTSFCDIQLPKARPSLRPAGSRGARHAQDAAALSPAETLSATLSVSESGSQQGLDRDSSGDGPGSQLSVESSIRATTSIDRLATAVLQIGVQSPGAGPMGNRAERLSGEPHTWLSTCSCFLRPCERAVVGGVKAGGR